VLNLGIARSPPIQLLMSFVDWQTASGSEERTRAMNLLQAWQRGEEAAEVREFAPLYERIAEITKGTKGRWFSESSRREMYLAAGVERRRSCDRRRAREETLLGELAAVCGDTMDDPQWQALRGQLEAFRCEQIMTALPGAQCNLSEMIAQLGDAPRFPSDAEPLDRARCQYLSEMRPLWVEKRLAWENQLEKCVSSDSVTPPSRKPALERVSRACAAIQLANELWAFRFGAVVGGKQGARLTIVLLGSLCPDAYVGWVCTFEEAMERAAQCADADVAKALVVNWRIRCELHRDVIWNAERERLIRMQAGKGVRKTETDATQKALLAAFIEESLLYRCLLEDDLACDLSVDPCLSALDAASKVAASGGVLGGD
jgi:hypothetical protein